MLHQLRIPGREVPLSWGHAGRFAPPGPLAHSASGLRVSLPFAADGLFLALRMAHRLLPSKHPNREAFPDHAASVAPCLPALPSTLHSPLVHFVVSTALSAS